MLCSHNETHSYAHNRYTLNAPLWLACTPNLHTPLVLRIAEGGGQQA
jgi:hypothetical protein